MKTVTTLTVISLLAAQCLTETPIPPKQEGVEIGNPTSSSRVDIFVDPHCPNSAKLFHNFKEVLDAEFKGKKIRDSISINLQIFPLPFHRNAFLAATALNFLRTEHPKHFVDFLQIELDSVDKYNTDAQVLSEGQVKELLLADARKAFGPDDSSDVAKIFSDASYNSAARITFKYGAFKGVTGTPSLYINHVASPIPETSQDLFYLLARYVDAPQMFF